MAESVFWILNPSKLVLAFIKLKINSNRLGNLYRDNCLGCRHTCSYLCSNMLIFLKNTCLTVAYNAVAFRGLVLIQVPKNDCVGG